MKLKLRNIEDNLEKKEVEIKIILESLKNMKQDKIESYVYDNAEHAFTTRDTQEDAIAITENVYEDEIENYDIIYNVAAHETRAKECRSEISITEQCSAPSSVVLKSSRGRVRDAADVHYLLEQKKVREAEIKKIEESFSLGFKPSNVKKPF